MKEGEKKKKKLDTIEISNVSVIFPIRKTGSDVKGIKTNIRDIARFANTVDENVISHK